MASIANAGNGGSLEKCRRRWDLADAEFLKYKFMNAFDRAMNHLDKAYSFSDNEHTYVSRKVRRPVENPLFTAWLWSNSCRVIPRCINGTCSIHPAPVPTLPPVCYGLGFRVQLLRKFVLPVHDHCAVAVPQYEKMPCDIRPYSVKASSVTLLAGDHYSISDLPPATQCRMRATS